jgi:hypothetical protein
LDQTLSLKKKLTKKITTFRSLALAALLGAATLCSAQTAYP